MVMPVGERANSESSEKRNKGKIADVFEGEGPSDSEPKARRRGFRRKDFLGRRSKEWTVNSFVCEDGSVDEHKEHNSVELRNSRKNQVTKLLGQ